jgi:hypothetical protein
MTDKPQTLDNGELETLLAEIQKKTDDTARLVEQVNAHSERLNVATDDLVDKVAENLSAARQAAGLPAKDPDEIKAAIERRQVVSR